MTRLQRAHQVRRSRRNTGGSGLESTGVDDRVSA